MVPRTESECHVEIGSLLRQSKVSSRAASKKVVSSSGTLEYVTSGLQQSIGVADIELRIPKLASESARKVWLENAN